MKTALITGITGQDGSYLAEFLLDKGYEVFGMKRRSSSGNSERIDHLEERPYLANTNFSLHYGDLTDALSIMRILRETQPDEVYNLGAQSHVKVSFDNPEHTANSDALGALRISEAIRILGFHDKIRFYQASSSEMFGKAQEVPQNEKTPFYPRNPYGVAKLYAHWMTVNYREAYGMHASNGILFNHESPRREENFVSRKITKAVAGIKLGLHDCLHIGNLNAERDWGHAKDYVRGMWQILQQDTPGDYVLATGNKHSVRQMIEMAFGVFEEQIEWKGEGLEEIGMLTSNSKVVVRINSEYFRPAEVDSLIGDASKAHKQLGWKITTTFPEMIEEMVLNDYKRLENKN